MVHSSQRILVPRERVIVALEQKISTEGAKYDAAREEYEKQRDAAKAWSGKYMPDLDRAFLLVHEEQRNRRLFRKYPEFSNLGDQFWFYRQPSRQLWAELQEEFPALIFRPCPRGGIGVVSLPRHKGYPVFVPQRSFSRYRKILDELPAAGVISLAPKLAEEIGLEYGTHEVVAELG